MDLTDIFKSANEVDTEGTKLPVEGDDGSAIEFKAPEELETEVVAADDDKKPAGADNKDSVDTKDSVDDSGYDAETIGLLYQAIAEKSGVSIDSVDLKSPEELVDAIENIISMKSKPQYANDLSEEFDLFLREGGNPIDFIHNIDPNYNEVVINTDEDKENAIRLVLKEAGFSEKQIDKKIDSYIENETLDEEAKDALDIIKRKNSKSIEESVRSKKQAEAEKEVERQKLFKSIETYIDEMKDVRGIPVTKQQTAALKNYLFKADKETGMTGYQKDFNESIANLIESAFFTQNKETLLKSAESKGSSDAMSKLKSLLKSNNKMSGTQGSNRGSADDTLAPWLKQAAALTGRAA